MSRLVLTIAVVFSLALSITNSLSAQDAPAPKLIVTIVVDPLSHQWIDQMKDQLGPGGIKKLLEQGVRFANAETGQILSNRSSSMATIASGATPTIHGIVGRSWYDRLRKEEVYSTEDFQIRSMAEYGQRAKHSAHHLLVTTFGDQLKSYSPGKVISVCLEPDGAILGSGHLSDGSYWFDSYSGRWISNSKFVQTIPQWVINFNNANQSEQYMNQEWDRLTGSTQYPNALPDNSRFEFGLAGENTTFPYKLKRLKRNTTEGEFEILRHTPFGNTLTADFAIAAIHNERLGAFESTDFLNITFTACNEIIKKFGHESQEATDAFLRLDLEISHLLYILEETVGKENVAVIFTATHGSSWNTDLASSRDLPAGRFRARNAIALLNSYLSAIYGENFWIESYINQQIYLDQTLIDQNKIPAEEIQEKAARFLVQFNGIAEALTAHQLSSAQVINPSGSTYQNAFQSNRSGDIILVLKPGWIQDGEFASDHLSPYPYDLRIPLIIWGGKIESKIIRENVTLQDIAPTCSDLANIPKPNGSTGKSLFQFLVN